jgi:hypothetical protein
VWLSPSFCDPQQSMGETRPPLPLSGRSSTAPWGYLSKTLSAPVDPGGSRSPICLCLGSRGPYLGWSRWKGTDARRSQTDPEPQTLLCLDTLAFIPFFTSFLSLPTSGSWHILFLLQEYSSSFPYQINFLAFKKAWHLLNPIISSLHSPQIELLNIGLIFKSYCWLQALLQ